MRDFKNILEDFTSAMDALREFVSNVAPVLLERQEQASQRAEGVTKRFLMAIMLTDDKFDSKMSEEEKKVIFEAKQLIAELERLHSVKNMSHLSEAIRKVCPIRFVNGKAEPDWDDPDAAEIIPTHRSFKSLKNQFRMLHESALMALTSRAEWFFAQMLHIYFSKHTGATGMTEPFFSLEMLDSLDSIAEAKELLIEHKIEMIMRSSFTDWIKFLKSTPKLKIDSTDYMVPSIAEVFLRRNIVVHAGGLVSRRYLETIEEAQRANFKLGDLIEITGNYLAASIDSIEQYFVLIGVELWKELFPKDEERGTFIQNLAVQKLNESRWELAKVFSRFGMYDRNLPEHNRIACQINYWQSFKWAGNYEEIKSDVDAFDISAKNRLFQLAHATIRDEFDVVFSMLPELLGKNELKKYQLMSWPLFKNVRERPEFSEFAATQREASN